MRWATDQATRFLADPAANPTGLPGRRSALTRASSLWRRRLNKPHYAFRPSQILRRVGHVFEGEQPDRLREVTLPWGLPIRFRDGHSAGSALARAGIYDLCVTETLYRLTDPGELAVDVGANIGYMTSVLAARVGPTGKVLAVEPNPEPRGLLTANVARWASENGTAALTVMEAALSDSSGIARLYAPDEHEWSSLIPPAGVSLSEARMLEVQTHRLDELIDEPIGVMKIDAEGAELAVLQGAEELLAKRWIRDVIFEDHRPYPKEVIRFFEPRGFSVFRVDQALFGLRVTAPGRGAGFSWDPPSYVATLDPDRALARLRKKGWAVFGIGGTSAGTKGD